MEQETGAQARKGSGLKQQALKRGPGFKLQAYKLTSAQATVRKLAHRGAWIKFRESGIVDRDTDEGVGWMLDMEGYLMWRKCDRITFRYF